MVNQQGQIIISGLTPDLLMSQFITPTVEAAVKKVLEDKGNAQEWSVMKPYTQKELADFLGCTQATIINMRSRKEIPFYFVGNSPRFDLQKVLKALDKNK